MKEANLPVLEKSHHHQRLIMRQRTDFHNTILDFRIGIIFPPTDCKENRSERSQRPGKVKVNLHRISSGRNSSQPWHTSFPGGMVADHFFFSVHSKSQKYIIHCKAEYRWRRTSANLVGNWDSWFPAAVCLHAGTKSKEEHFLTRRRPSSSRILWIE